MNALKNSTASGNSYLRFSRDQKNGFYPTLKNSVNSYFQEHHLSQRANASMIFKIVFFLSTTIGLYALLISGVITSFWALNLVWIGLGLFVAFTALNICHDAIHGALTNNKVVETIFKYLFNILGANAYIWHIMHNVVHHTYTNIPDHDEDIHIVPIIRLSPTQTRFKIHRYQHFYAFGLYSLSSLLWVFIKDYVKFFKSSIGSYKVDRHPPIEYFNLFFFKAIHYLLFIVIPFTVIALPWWQILLGYLLMHVFEGLTLSLIFMLAHAVEETAFPMPDEKGKMEEAWAVHQLKTSANFCCKSPLVTFFCGGLNFQIEHHLFPHICHIHYPKLAPIVRQTADRFDLTYIEKETLPKAFKDHYLFLKRMGSPTNVVAENSAVSPTDS